MLRKNNSRKKLFLSLLSQMSLNQLSKKSFAIILLLLFLQKSGVELYVHSRFHVKNCQQTSSTSKGSHINGIGCTCVDDFLMPFTDGIQSFMLAILPTQNEYFGFRKALASYSTTFFFSLRAPPISLL